MFYCTFNRDAKKWTIKSTETMSWIKRKKKHLHFKNTSSKGSSWIHPHVHTHCTDLTRDYGNLRLFNKTIMETESAHICIHRPPCLIYSSYLGEVQTFLLWNQTFKYFYHCTGTRFFLLYILTFSQRLNRWHQQLSYRLLAMNEIYILKNNLSTTATSGHQIYYKETII